MQAILSAVTNTHGKLMSVVKDPDLNITINGVNAYDEDTDTLKVRVSKGGVYGSFDICKFTQRTADGSLDSDFFRSAAYHIDHILTVQ